MIRVLFINHSSTIGGAETNLLNIIRFSHQGGFLPVGVILPDDGPLVRPIQELNCIVGFTTYHKFNFRNPLRYLQTLWQLVDWIRRTKADLVHLNHQWLVEYAVKAAHVTGRPLICHTRNYLDAEFASEHAKAFARCDTILTVSDVAQRRAQDLNVRQSKLHLIHDGIDLSHFDGYLAKQSDKAGIGLSQAHPVIGFVGRIVPEKGPEDLLKAFSLTLDAHPTAQLLFAGADSVGGSYIAHLNALSEQLRISDRVKFIGFQADVAPVLGAIDVLVVPSRTSMPEGLPLSILEGMMAGCVVVATPNSGIVEVVHEGRTGFLVEMESPKSLAATIINALDLPVADRQKMTSNARSLIVQNFSIQQQVESLGYIYRSLVS